MSCLTEESMFCFCSVDLGNRERRPCPPVAKPLRRSRPRLRRRSRAPRASRHASGNRSLPTSSRACRRRLPEARTPPPYGAGFGTRRAASLLGMRAERFGPPLRQATSARNIGRKPLKRLIPRPGLPQTSTPLPAPARFGTRRVASLLGMRERFHRPLRQARSARRIGRKPLKRLIPRPGLPQTSTPLPARARFATRRVASLLDRRAERARPPLRQATSARKIGRKSLKRLNPRPGLPQTSTPPPARARFATRRVASRLGMRAERFGPPLRQATSARKIGRKPLKRLIPRPGLPQPSAWPPLPPFESGVGIEISGKPWMKAEDGRPPRRRACHGRSVLLDDAPPLRAARRGASVRSWRNW